jgi:hypothetical protein
MKNLVRIAECPICHNAIYCCIVAVFTDPKYEALREEEEKHVEEYRAAGYIIKDIEDAQTGACDCYTPNGYKKLLEKFQPPQPSGQDEVPGPRVAKKLRTDGRLPGGGYQPIDDGLKGPIKPPKGGTGEIREIAQDEARAQGRRDAAEAYCKLCGACIPVLVKCKNYHVILGDTASGKTKP